MIIRQWICVLRRVVSINVSEPCTYVTCKWWAYGFVLIYVCVNICMYTYLYINIRPCWYCVVRVHRISELVNMCCRFTYDDNLQSPYMNLEFKHSACCAKMKEANYVRYVYSIKFFTVWLKRTGHIFMMIETHQQLRLQRKHRKPTCLTMWAGLTVWSIHMCRFSFVYESAPIICFWMARKAKCYTTRQRDFKSQMRILWITDEINRV